MQTPATPTAQGTRTVAALTVTSLAFAEGERIPTRYTADGENVSPPLAWQPARSTDKPPASYGLVCEDPDAPSGLFVHWVVWDIRGDATSLPEAISHDASAGPGKQGKNGFGGLGYGGPKPPPGKPHHYRVRLYALDTRLDLPTGATRADFDQAIEGHVLAEGLLTGVYSR